MTYRGLDVTDVDARILRRIAISADGVDVASVDREMQHVRRNADHQQEDDQRIRQERFAAHGEVAAVCQVEQRRAAEAQRSTFGDGLRDPAKEQHAAERYDERLKLEPRDEQALQ